ncbi:MAG: NTP transferase domain-containing protein [Anaerolineales bacterium]|nr:NTP transferase domain-containing protein [Anaerolineales bacterium]
MNVVVLAGGELKSEDPLFGLVPPGAPPSKAYLSLAGKPMLQWVLDALGDSNMISGVIVVGQPENADFKSAKPISYIEDQGGLIENALAGIRYSAEQKPGEKYTLLASGDIPLLTPEMVDWVVENGLQSRADLVYHVITDKVMEERFPGANRTFISLKGIRVCGGDLNLISHRLVEQNNYIWEELAARRKSPIRQAALLGPGILLGLMLRILSLEQGVELVSKRLGLVGKAVESPYAELGMDIDKPGQYELVKNEMSAGRR